jgi:glucokinase
MTNAPWDIDGHELASRLGIPTRLINDFTAVSYGVLLLDPEDPEELLRLPHPDGSDPRPGQGVKVILGAGTGLGMGFVVRVGDRVEAFPTEGGHVTLPVFDAESRALQAWLEARMDYVPGAEAAVSGSGIANIHEFLTTRVAQPGPLSQAILAAPAEARPALISEGAARDPLCAQAMDLFVRLYARVAADAAATFMPAGGIYLAGGIAAKNAARFTEGGLFMETFSKSYREHIRNILAATPVMIVKDYAISLYGAANAAALGA